ncbi:MAG: MATE family efflux transporter [Pseudomonadales bacterium]|jgi:MATE family multidrug resistance protein|nr:MATE family efflux transporter [Pseudomonadales bacterium]
MSFLIRNLTPDTLKALLRLCIPMIISQGAFALMIFCARYFLAQISPVHMAAAMGAGVAWFFTYALFNGILAYANALVAQYLGAGQPEKCSKVVTQGLLLACACIPLLALAAYGIRYLFVFMGHAPEQAALELRYYDVILPASFLMLLKVCFASFFTGIGRTRVVMICELSGIALNLPLSYLLIFGKGGLPALDITGAALASVLSTSFTLVLFIAFYFRRNNRLRFQVARSWAFDGGIIRRYLRLGFPSGVETFLNVAAFNLFILMFHSYGEVEAAAATIVFSWDILSFVPLLGLNIAVMSLTGHAAGAKQLQRTDAITSAGYVLGLGYSVLLALAFVLLRAPLVEVFIFEQDDAIADAIGELTRFMMLGLSGYVLLEGLLQVAAGVLRGAGDTQWVMRASVTLHWLMLVSQYAIIKVFGLGPRLSWMTFVLMVVAIVVLFLHRLHQGRWRSPERIAAVMAER